MLMTHSATQKKNSQTSQLLFNTLRTTTSLSTTFTRVALQEAQELPLAFLAMMSKSKLEMETHSLVSIDQVTLFTQNTPLETLPYIP